MAVLAMLLVPGQATAKVRKTAALPQYTLTDLGTFGGPNTYMNSLNGDGQRGEISSSGIVVGAADTSIVDPKSPSGCYNSDCRVSHAFRWSRGNLHDLGALPAGSSSQSDWISRNGRWIAGFSTNGKIDPVVKFYALIAVVWKDGRLRKIGTLGGSQSASYAANNSGEVVGLALNKTPDSFSGLGTQTRAFLWRKGRIRDLGTLGGPDAVADFLNNKGQIAGTSFTDTTVHTATGMPTNVPFIWQRGKMASLGSLGGTTGYPTDINSAGQIVGQSNVKGDKSAHPFLWSHSKLTDLRTLGGDNGLANMVNDNTAVVGWANNTTPCAGCGQPISGGATSQNYHAVLWRHGRIIDIGVVKGDRCSNASAINSAGLIVGSSGGGAGGCHGPSHAFLWKNGRIGDLNTLLVPSAPHVFLYSANAINDQGEIAVEGTTLAGQPGCAASEPSGRCFHAYLLKPIKTTS
jgi:probable HAF family extracellular repeat protein